MLWNDLISVRPLYICFFHACNPAFCCYTHQITFIISDHAGHMWIKLQRKCHMVITWLSIGHDSHLFFIYWFLCCLIKHQLNFSVDFDLCSIKNPCVSTIQGLQLSKSIFFSWSGRISVVIERFFKLYQLYAS